MRGKRRCLKTDITRLRDGKEERSEKKPGSSFIIRDVRKQGDFQDGVKRGQKVIDPFLDKREALRSREVFKGNRAKMFPK